MAMIMIIIMTRIRSISHWNNLPDRVVAAESVKTFKPAWTS